MCNKKANHFQGCQNEQDINNRNYYTVTDAGKNTLEENSCDGNTACSDNRTFQQKLMLTPKVMFFFIRVDADNLYLIFFFLR